MTDPSGARLHRRHADWESERGNWDELMEEIAEYMVPGKRGFNLTFTPGEQRMERVFDSTVFDCITRFVDAVHFAIANPFTAWFGLRYRQSELNDDHDASTWLDDCQERMQQAFKESNWSEQLNEALTDWATFGTEAMTEEERPLPSDGDPEQFQGLVFKAHHLSNCTWGEDHDGSVRTFNIRRSMTVEQVWKRFARSADKEDQSAIERTFGSHLSKKINDMLADRGDPDEKVELLQCMWERDPADVRLGPTIGKHRRFACVWVALSEGGRQKKIHTTGYYELPFFVARYRERSEDKNGIGLGELSLPDVRTLNEAERLDLGAWEQDIDPPIVQEGYQILGDIQFIARGITTVRNLNKVRAWTDLVRRSYQPNQVRAEEKREQIRAIWKYHQLDLPPRERVGEMTATEVVKRMQRIYQLMGPPLARLINELISPAIERTFSMMLRRGAFQEPPQILLDTGAEYDIEYTGPLARAQGLEEVETIDQFLAELYSAAANDPELLDLVDRDEMWRTKATKMGIAAKLMRETDEVRTIRDDRAKAAEAQRKAELEAMQSEAVRNIGQGLGEENAREAITTGLRAAA